MMHPEPKALVSEEGGIHPWALAPVEEGDPEWVADLFDILHEGDVEASLAGLESLLRSMRKAAKARHVLAGLEPGLIGRGLEVRATRRGSRR